MNKPLEITPTLESTAYGYRELVAKDVFCSMLRDAEWSECGCEFLAGLAVQYTDELIKALNKETTR